jgi:hypothetical protein
VTSRTHIVLQDGSRVLPYCTVAVTAIIVVIINDVEKMTTRSIDCVIRYSNNGRH